MATKSFEGDWSVKELTELMLDALKATTSGCCLFLDGLDESELDEKREFTHLIKMLSEVSSVKLCVYSRPENIFQSELQNYPTFKVQDINNPGIKAYVTSTLAPYRDKCVMPESGQYEFLVQTLVGKAEGVFLWSRVALKSILRGLDNLDPWDTLVQRSESLEPDLYSLYKHIWLRNMRESSFYATETSRMFWFQLYGASFPPDFRPRSIADILVSKLGMGQTSRSDLENILKSKGKMSRNELVHLAASFDRWLYARSVGLLEIVEMESYSPCVTFIHRSVQGFLINTPEGKEILSHDMRSTISRWESVAEAHFVATLLSRHLPDSGSDDHCDMVVAERVTWLSSMFIAVGETGDTVWRDFPRCIEALIDSLTEETSPYSFQANITGALIRTEKWQQWYYRLPTGSKSHVLWCFCHQILENTEMMRNRAKEFVKVARLESHPVANLTTAAWTLTLAALRWMVDNGADPAQRIPRTTEIPFPSFAREYTAFSSLESTLWGWLNSWVNRPGDAGFAGTLSQAVDILRFRGNTGPDLLSLSSVTIITKLFWRRFNNPWDYETNRDKKASIEQSNRFQEGQDRFSFLYNHPSPTHIQTIFGRIDGTRINAFLNSKGSCDLEYGSKNRERGILESGFHTTRPLFYYDGEDIYRFSESEAEIWTRFVTTTLGAKWHLPCRLSRPVSENRGNIIPYLRCNLRDEDTRHDRFGNQAQSWMLQGWPGMSTLRGRAATI